MTDRTAPRYRVAAPPRERPLFLFDGDCRFCRLWVNRWRGMTRGRVDFATAAEAAGRFPEIPDAALRRRAVLVGPEGDVFEGAGAVLRALATTRRLPLWLYLHVPAAAAISEALYALVARNRMLSSRLTGWLWGDHLERPSYGRARCLFLRLLGAVYLMAFLSLWVQLDGLAGENGILPARPFLQAVLSQRGPVSYWLAPTLFWIHPGDTTLHLLAGAGTLVSCLLILGLLPVPSLSLLWVFYLSLTVVCRTFLGFQWDNLLLETGLLAIFVAPLRWRCGLRCGTEPSRLPLWLLRWLLFRLMFSSGVVKLASGDPAWRSLTALEFHYWTQPLPIWTSWYVQQLPAWFHELSTALMFFVELAVPFLLFAPRRPRLSAFWALVTLQVLIAATGNYAFFNILSVVLCLLLLDDAFWLRVGSPVRARLSRSLRPTFAPPSVRDAAAGSGPAAPRARSLEWPLWVTVPFAAVILTVSSMRMFETIGSRGPWPRPLATLDGAIAPFRSINRYGLFAVMTTSRREIVIEGSDDGRTWRPYEFRWKPGDLHRRPPLVAPHQPRLDWQMWFAALGDYRSSPWFTDLLARLLEGSPPVLRLLRTNPFPEAPPRYVRAFLYDYHFTDLASSEGTGDWWRRELIGPYCPPVSLRARSDPDPRP